VCRAGRLVSTLKRSVRPHSSRAGRPGVDGRRPRQIDAAEGPVIPCLDRRACPPGHRDRRYRPRVL